jgi:hypothetical protein
MSNFDIYIGGVIAMRESTTIIVRRFEFTAQCKFNRSEEDGPFTARKEGFF